jgi:hypothetical protein
MSASYVVNGFQTSTQKATSVDRTQSREGQSRNESKFHVEAMLDEVIDK